MKYEWFHMINRKYLYTCFLPNINHGIDTVNRFNEKTSDEMIYDGNVISEFDVYTLKSNISSN